MNQHSCICTNSVESIEGRKWFTGRALAFKSYTQKSIKSNMVGPFLIETGNPIHGEIWADARAARQRTSFYKKNHSSSIHIHSVSPFVATVRIQLTVLFHMKALIVFLFSLEMIRAGLFTQRGNFPSKTRPFESAYEK